MKNKVLIKLIVPEVSESYDLFIPVNEYIWRIVKLLVKAVCDLSDNALDIGKDYYLINIENNTIYQNNQIVINTDIRNSSKIMLISNHNQKNYDSALRMNISAKRM